MRGEPSNMLNTDRHRLAPVGPPGASLGAGVRIFGNLCIRRVTVKSAAYKCER